MEDVLEEFLVRDAVLVILRARFAREEAGPLPVEVDQVSCKLEPFIFVLVELVIRGCAAT